MAGSEDELATGQFRRHRRLGSDAIYRIDSLGPEYVRVEVVSAPGLRAGQHFKFSRAAVELMELVAPPEDPAAPEPRPAVTAAVSGHKRAY